MISRRQLNANAVQVDIGIGDVLDDRVLGRVLDAFTLVVRRLALGATMVVGRRYVDDQGLELNEFAWAQPEETEADAVDGEHEAGLPSGVLIHRVDYRTLAAIDVGYALRVEALFLLRGPRSSSAPSLPPGSLRSEEGRRGLLEGWEEVIWPGHDGLSLSVITRCEREIDWIAGVEHEISEGLVDP